MPEEGSDQESDSSRLSYAEDRVKDEIEQIREDVDVEFNRRHKMYAAGLTVLTGIVALTFFAALSASGSFQLADNTTEPQENSSKAELNLTDYQEEYVNCGREYLEICTKMSKIPTEEISYWKQQNDWLYFKLGDGRAILSTVPNETHEGEFVTYMSAAEVERMENRTANSTAS